MLFSSFFIDFAAISMPPLPAWPLRARQNKGKTGLFPDNIKVLGDAEDAKYGCRKLLRFAGDIMFAEKK